MPDILIQKENSQLRRMEKNDLDMVRGWRNHLNVRRYMYTQHEISSTEHHAWFERERKDCSKHLLIFEYDKTPKGYLNLNTHGGSPIVDWGFYLAPNSERGIGKKLGVLALEYAFLSLKLHKICGQALAYNEKSIGFHQRLGFNQEGRLIDQHYDGEEFHDVCLFGLLAQDWIRTRNKND
ncbi:MAG: UDP-4-amino-4,6-dideoxy-N-acetyl-beta-L-altrosamine N-acetyltransferase [Oleiphilaceae bacterium]|jgi:UDP-4-amino-4,6-dideoxy-N-acetyl-beta-L-altrosamine N-acetyltransferase